MEAEKANQPNEDPHRVQREATYRSDLEEAVRSSEMSYGHALEGLQEGVWIIDKDACTTYASSYVAGMLGCRPEEMLGKPLLSFMDAPTADNFKDVLKQCQQGMKQRREAGLLRKEGTCIRAAIEISPLADQHGNYDGAIGRVQDLTALARARQELRETQEHYRLLAENVEDGIWTTDMDLRLTYLSPSAKRLRGYSAEEAMSQQLDQMLTRDSLHHAMDVFKEQLALEKEEQKDLSRSWSLELETYRKDGSTIWVEEKVTFLRDAQGRPIGLLGVTRDITDRKRAQEALKESERRFRLVTETIQDVFWIRARGLTETVYVNPAYEALWGHSRESLYQSPASFLDAIHEDDRQRVTNTIRTQSDGEWDMEYRIVRPDGSIRWVRDRSSCIRNESGEPYLITGLAMDITERKETEEALLESERELLTTNRIAQILLTVPDDQMYADVLQVILEATDSKYGIFGYIDESGRLVLPSLTRDIWEQCQVADKSTVYPPETWGGIWGDALLEKRSLYANEGLRVPRCHLSIQRVLVVPIMYKDHVIGILEIANKATDYEERDQKFLEAIADKIAPVLHARLQRQSAEKLLHHLYQTERELREKLEAEIKARAEFTRALVHELKTPLTPILAASSALTEMLDEGVAQEFARNVTRGASRLSSRIDEMLDLARGETGTLDLVCSEVDPLPLLETTVSDMAPVARARKQMLVLQLPHFLPPIWADDTRLRQVVLNLLGNALKFTPERGTIVLRAREEACNLVIEVEDNGPGIPQEDQRWLFQPYRRLKRGTRSSGGGLGLGLALSKTLVELHGGQIWARSEEGRGSTFGFSVPLGRGRELADGRLSGP